MSRLEKLYKYIDNQYFQSKLRSINILVALISFVYIFFLFKESIENNLVIRKINIVELVFLIFLYILVGLTWVRFSNRAIFKKNKKIFWEWSFSNLGKYFPGGLGLISIRLNQNKTEPNSKKIIFGLLEEQFLIPILSLPVLLCSILFLNNKYIYLNLIIAQVTVIFIFKKFYFYKEQISQVSMLNYPVNIFFIILGNYLITFFIFSNFYPDNFIDQAFYYLIASNLGLFFVGVPAGLGIREAFFLTFLGKSFLISEQIELLIYIRFLYLIVDVIFGILGFFLKEKSL